MPEEAWNRFRRDFRWLARQTSEPRDLDVYLLDFDDFAARLPESDRPALEPFRGWLRRRADAVHAELTAALDSERTTRLLDDWAAFLATPTVATGPRLADFAADVIERSHARLLRDGRAIEAITPDEALHDLRKRAKSLRYLLDGFKDLLPATSAKAQIKHLKALQDLLGLHQDRAVQVELLRSVARELAQAPADTLVAFGYLIEQLDRDRHRLRDGFAARFVAYDRVKRLAAFESMLARTHAGSGRKAVS